MKKIWNFLSDPKNLAVLVMIGGAVAWLWKEMEPHQAEVPAAAKQIAQPQTPPPVAPNSVNQTAIAEGGGSAVIAGPGATVNTNRGNAAPR